MEKLPQEVIQRWTFISALEREELLIKKYEDYMEVLKDKELRDLLKDFMRTSQDHIKLLKDKMNKLKVQ